MAVQNASVKWLDASMRLAGNIIYVNSLFNWARPSLFTLLLSEGVPAVHLTGHARNAFKNADGLLTDLRVSEALGYINCFSL